MDVSRFDGLVRSMLGSRRALFAGGGALAASWLGGSAVEAKRRKRKKRKKKRTPKATPNAFGCLEVNDPCTSAEQCCSGICEGKRCRAHGTANCPQDREGICLASADDVPFLKCGNSELCFCHTTTAGSNYCAEGIMFVPHDGKQCADCRTDADCLALGYPPGAACAPVDRGYCGGGCPSGMACLVPCGTVLPEA